MQKAKNPKKEDEPKISYQSPFAGFSRFGKPNQFIGPRLNQKAFSNKPAFVTQHKGGGGK